MAHYAPLYDPPATGNEDIEKVRERVFADADRELFLHIGQFITWYAAVEFNISMLLFTFTRSIDPVAFHLLTRGMDAKVKVERLLVAVEQRGWTVAPGLKTRIDHFSRRQVKLRNQIVHSYLYWPEDRDLQITSLGTPPQFADGEARYPAPPPDTISGLELFERGIWLHHFAADLGYLFLTLKAPLLPGGTLQRETYQSPLPTGDRPSPQKQAQRAKLDRPAQKRPPG